jgi:hypothetical protein
VEQLVGQGQAQSEPSERLHRVGKRHHCLRNGCGRRL